MNNEEPIEIEDFLAVEKALQMIGSPGRNRSGWLVLEEPNVRFCRVQAVSHGFRVEWMENLSATGPRLPLARAYLRGSQHPSFVTTTAVQQDDDRLTIVAAREILRAFHDRKPRPHAWDWVPISMTHRLA